MRFRHSISAGGEQERVYLNYWRPMEDQLGGNLPEFLRHYAMKEGDNINQGGIYAATKAHLKNMDSPDKVEDEVKRMQKYASLYAKFITPSLEANPQIQKYLCHINELAVTTSYPLLLRLMGARSEGTMTDEALEKCLELVESFVVRRAVCYVPTNALNKLFLQWAKNFPESEHFAWLHKSMSSGGGGRRFPNDVEFSEAFTNQPQYGRGTTRFILCQLEKSFDHKEPVDLAQATIEHVLPQTMTPEWESELGLGFEEVHGRLIDTFGNLTLTGYNPELGNIPFSEKKIKLQNTHIELNRWILERQNWRGLEIVLRSSELFGKAKAIWTGPEVVS